MRVFGTRPDFALCAAKKKSNRVSGVTFAATSFMKAIRIVPHIAQKSRSSAVDYRTARSPAYARSQRRRKAVEEIFGWLKSIGLCRKMRFRGPHRVGWIFRFAVAGLETWSRQPRDCNY